MQFAVAAVCAGVSEAKRSMVGSHFSPDGSFRPSLIVGGLAGLNQAGQKNCQAVIEFGTGLPFLSFFTSFPDLSKNLITPLFVTTR